MKRAPILALALLAACATPRPASEAAAPAQPAQPPAGAARALMPSERLSALSRAMTVIDDAERRGDLAAERARRTAAAAAPGAAPEARLLAIYAKPHVDLTWAELAALGKEQRTSALPAVAMARIYLEWRVPDQVPRLLESVADVDAGDWLVELVRAQTDERGERREAAAAGYGRVVAVDPGNVDAHVGLARLALRAGDRDAARSEAEAALAGLPDHTPALAVLADLAAASGDQPGAVAAWRRIVAASPRDRAARLGLARLLQGQGDAAGARDQLAAALALREDPDALAALAEASRAAGDRASEQRALERLGAVDPNGAEWKRLAEIRQAGGDLDGAEKALRRALVRDPKDLALQASLGRVVLLRGKPQEALELLRGAAPEGAPDREALEHRLNLERTPRGDVDSVQRAVGRLIDRTYRGRLKELPRLSGRLTVRVTVDAAGVANLVEVLEDSVHDEDVRACAYWNLRDASYPPNKPGRYSFAFSLRPVR
jgi:tetratricopeptide (TPR) repeat protein